MTSSHTTRKVHRVVPVSVSSSIALLRLQLWRYPIPHRHSAAYQRDATTEQRHGLGRRIYTSTMLLLLTCSSSFSSFSSSSSSSSSSADYCSFFCYFSVKCILSRSWSVGSSQPTTWYLVPISPVMISICFSSKRFYFIVCSALFSLKAA